MTQNIPKPPTGLHISGRALWRSVLHDYELDEHERTILRECCRTADSLDGLQALLDTEGLTSQSSQGVRVHPALVELRQQRLVLARLLAGLRIPTGETGQHTQPRDVPKGMRVIRGGAV